LDSNIAFVQPAATPLVLGMVRTPPQVAGHAPA